MKRTPTPTERTRTVERPDAPPVGGELELPERYRDQGLIGRGGMGEVRRVWDCRLKRRLAMKILRTSLAGDARAARRFLVEAQRTAGLQHPGIVAVHDQGVLPDGRPWLTMKEIRGRTFDALLAEGPSDETPEPVWLRRHLGRFASVCQTVAFAHHRGVVHRDLKPTNLMVGEYGEVLVLDWGISAHTLEEPGPEDEPCVDAESGLTHAGEILGTPAYVAPECLWPDPPAVAPTLDVYALGCILYVVLTGRPAYSGTRAQVHRRVRAGPPPPVREAARAAGRAPPDELCGLCERAMEPDPTRRIADANEVAEALQEWLDGARRRARADDLLAEADALRPKVHTARAAAARMRVRATEMLEEIQRHEPEQRKRPAWDLEDRADELERSAVMGELEWVHRVRSALNLLPNHAPARQRLAEHYAARARHAEARGDANDLACAEALLEAHDDGRHATWLRGDAVLELCTEPPDSRITLFRYVRDGRRLVPRALGAPESAPLRGRTVPHGSYLAVVEARGHATLQCPILLERAGHAESTPVPMLPSHALGPNACYVPPGWFTAGGDAEAADGLARSRVWLDGFVIDRFPVTNRDYIAFLDDLVDRGDAARAELYVPREQGHGEEELPLYGRDEADHFTLLTDRDGEVWQPDWPVTMVSWHAAMAYAAWRSERDGLPWRLPHDLEWAKAARGVDGRCYPWGNHGEPTWARMAGSLPDRMSRAPVDSHPIDVSPYGVRGLGGNVRDWCLNPYLRGGPEIVHGRVAIEVPRQVGDDYRMVRGGCWASPPSSCRATCRFASRPGVRSSVVGFRLARSCPR